MLNRIIIMGRLVRDPELRTTQSGVSVTSFTLAVDRDFKNRDSGEKSTDFIDVVAWRQTAEFICKYFGKGRMAVAEGRLQIRDWKDRDAPPRWWQTTSTSLTASATAPAAATATAPPRPMARPPRPPTAAASPMAAATAPPPGTAPASLKSTTRTAICPFNRRRPICGPPAATF